MPVISSEKNALTHDSSVNKLYVTTEESREPEVAKVKGKIPSYIVGGKYMRVGPCKFDFKDFTVNHWLDGYGLLSKFEIQNDVIKYEKKYLQSEAYKRAMAQQKPAINEFGTRGQTDVKKGFFSKVISNLLPEFTDNSYSTLYKLGQDLFATCDTQYFQKIQPSKLNVECRYDTAKLFSMNGHCAHPLTDDNGDVYNVGFSVGAMGLKCHVVRIPFAVSKSSEDMLKNAKNIATFTSRWSGHISTAHSFGMSEKYIIFVEQPYTVSLKRIAASFVKEDVLKDWMEWRPEEKNRFIIIEKATGKVYKTDIMTDKSFYFMHFANCFEIQSNQIVVDIITYDSPRILDSMMIANLRSKSKLPPVDLPHFQRFIVPVIPDLKGANVPENVNLVNGINSTCTAIRTGNKVIITGEKLTGGGLDLPTMNRRYFQKRARYFYATSTVYEHEYSNCVCKVDVESKQVLKWKIDDYTSPGEPYFVPDPNGTKEDDGVVIFAVTDIRMDKDDYLVMLDARTWKEIARANFKSHVPSSLHGIFLPN